MIEKISDTTTSEISLFSLSDSQAIYVEHIETEDFDFAATGNEDI